jgi:hypothetical protein
MDKLGSELEIAIVSPKCQLFSGKNDQWEGSGSFPCLAAEAAQDVLGLGGLNTTCTEENRANHTLHLIAARALIDVLDGLPEAETKAAEESSCFIVDHHPIGNRLPGGQEQSQELLKVDKLITRAQFALETDRGLQLEKDTILTAILSSLE